MLEGILRENKGKSNARALRNQDYIIANLYGSEHKENICAAFKKNEFIKFVKNKTTFAFDVNISGTTYNVVIQEYQKHPVSYAIKHVDLIITSSKKQYYMLPIRTSGVPIGVKNKGILAVHKNRLRVKANIKDLPPFLEIDVANLDIGDNILVKDISLKNTEIFINPTVPIAGIIKAK